MPSLPVFFEHAMLREAASGSEKAALDATSGAQMDPLHVSKGRIAYAYRTVRGGVGPVDQGASRLVLYSPKQSWQDLLCACLDGLDTVVAAPVSTESHDRGPAHQTSCSAQNGAKWSY
jgi:hypothetical protein